MVKKRNRGEGVIKIDVRVKCQNDKMMLRSMDKTKEEVWGLAMTEAERHVYLIIEVFWEKYGFAPSYADIAFLRGTSGIGNIKRIVDKLVQMGAVKRIPHAKRSVRPVHINFKHLE